MKTHCTNADHLRSFQIWIPGTAAKRLWVRIDGVRNPCVWIFFIVTWVHFQPLKVLQSTLPLSWSAHTHVYIYSIYIYVYVHIYASISRFSVHLSNSLHQSFYLVTSLVLSYLISSCLIYLCARDFMYVYILVTSWIYTVFVSYMITTLYWRRTYLNVKFIIYTHIQRHTCSHMYTRKILPLLGGDAPNLFQGCNQVTGLKIFTSEKRNDNWSLTGMMEWWTGSHTFFNLFLFFSQENSKHPNLFRQFFFLLVLKHTGKRHRILQIYGRAM